MKFIITIFVAVISSIGAIILMNALALLSRRAYSLNSFIFDVVIVATVICFMIIIKGVD